MRDSMRGPKAWNMVRNSLCDTDNVEIKLGFLGRKVRGLGTTTPGFVIAKRVKSAHFLVCS